MNTDYRVTTDALDHPKLVKLKRLTGDAGIICLFRLWGFTARYHPKGNLNTMTDEDIEIAAKWEGQPGIFFSALIKLKLLDETLGLYSIHDWEEHNSYAFHAPERSDKAKHAARMRWESKEDATSNAQSNATRNAPSPNPNPNPKKETPKKELSPVGDEPAPQDELFPSGNGKPKKKSPIPIRLRKVSTPAGRLAVKFCQDFYDKHNQIEYTGIGADWNKTIERALSLGKTEKQIRAAIRWLFDQDEQTEIGSKKPYLKHSHLHFLKYLDDYVDKARSEDYE